MTQTAALNPKKKKSKRPRFYGHIPDETYELVTDFKHPRWLLFCRKSTAPVRWVELKLARRGASDVKSNFWLAWSPTERRFAMNHEFKMLACREQDLLDSLHNYLLDF
jgi:hypothetical protein